MRHAARTDELSVREATEPDVPAVAAVRNAAADGLTRRHGRGHWSVRVTAQGQLRSMAASRVLVACAGRRIAGTLRLTTKKPFAIDANGFAAVPRPLYLVDMAVAPDWQGRGIGRFLVQQAAAAAAAWPADAIRLDAYDSPAGAGPFYVKCGFREIRRATFRGVPLVFFERLLAAHEG